MQLLGWSLKKDVEINLISEKEKNWLSQEILDEKSS